MEYPQLAHWTENDTVLLVAVCALAVAHARCWIIGIRRGGLGEPAVLPISITAAMNNTRQ